MVIQRFATKMTPSWSKMAPNWSKMEPKSRRLDQKKIAYRRPFICNVFLCFRGPFWRPRALFLDPFWSRMAHLVTNLGSRVRPLLSFGSPLGSMWMVCCVFSVTFWLRASVCLNCSVLCTICTVAQSPLVEFSHAQWLHAAAWRPRAYQPINHHIIGLITTPI